MLNTDNYRLLADLVLILHVSFVVFVVFGLFTILCGGLRGWKWIRSPLFRSAHLGAICIVIIQAWLGIICPLTILENHLREKAGAYSYGGSFIAYWLHKALFFQAAPWIFGLCYTLFGIAVIHSWIKYQPRPFRKKS